jgi:putative tricarboxylic transport membrane protein
MLEGILIGLAAAVTPFNLMMVVVGCVIGTA